MDNDLEIIIDYCNLNINHYKIKRVVKNNFSKFDMILFKSVKVYEKDIRVKLYSPKGSNYIRKLITDETRNILNNLYFKLHPHSFYKKKYQTKIQFYKLRFGEEVPDDTTNRKECSVCLVEEPKFAFVPCGHKCLCKNCSKTVSKKECIICSAKTKKIIEIFEV